MNRVFFAEIPVPHLVEIQKGRVVTCNLTHFFAVLFYFAPNKVLLFKIVCSAIKVADNIIGFVSKGDPVCQLVNYCANEEAVKEVICMVPLYRASICEFNLLKSIAFSSAVCKTSINFHIDVPIQFPLIIWSFNQIVTSRWMVTGLFIKALRTICSIALVSLSKDWIKRFCKDVLVSEPRDTLRHDKFHSFYWVGCLARFVKVSWHCRSHLVLHLQKCLCRHALDWETNSS